MIIKMISIKRADANDIDTNVGYLIKANLDHKIINGDALTSDTDRKHQIFIVGHGSPDFLAERTPLQLARLIAKYINDVYQHHKHAITEIVILSCNTGKIWEKRSFIDSFTLLLSERLTIPFTINISAPNGMVVFYPDGNYAVIKDENPFVVDNLLSQKLSQINIEDIETAKKQVEGLLEKNSPIANREAYSFKRILKSPKEIVLNHNKAITVKEINNRYEVSPFLHCKLTKLYAHQEQDKEENLENKENNSTSPFQLKNVSFYGLEKNSKSVQKLPSKRSILGCKNF